MAPSATAPKPTRREAALRLHLGSEHVLGNWLEVRDPEGIHREKHADPDAAQDHPLPTLINDPLKAVLVALEAVE